MSFRCPYLPSSLKLVLLISIPTSFIFPAHSQTFANPSLPDAPTPQASNELAQDAAAQNGQQTDPNPSESKHAPPAEPIASPASDGLWRRKYLFGDWYGERERLEVRGLNFDFYYIGDALGNPYGGRADFGNWGRIRGTVDVDFSKFTPARGLTFHM